MPPDYRSTWAFAPQRAGACDPLPFTVSEALSFALLALTIEVDHIVEFKECYGKATVGGAP